MFWKTTHWVAYYTKNGYEIVIMPYQTMYTKGDSVVFVYYDATTAIKATDVIKTNLTKEEANRFLSFDPIKEPSAKKVYCIMGEFPNRTIVEYKVVSEDNFNYVAIDAHSTTNNLHMLVKAKCFDSLFDAINGLAWHIQADAQAEATAIQHVRINKKNL